MVEKRFRAGIYVRLSNERSESWREKSQSPQTQTLACKDYAKQENIEVVGVYEDYEFSGTNFDRPAYQQMMQDVRDRKINCIIVKDLSRLGREHLEMGRLIDKVFPFLGVRFISVNDKLDTEKGVDNGKSFEVVLKNIINDMYAKDISVKIKTSKHNRAKKGYFIGSVAPFGYSIHKDRLGQRLVVNPDTAPITRLIFELAAQGMPQLSIIRELDRRNYATPTVYKKTKRVQRMDGDPYWSVGTIAKILTNEAYLGHMIQARRQQDLSKNQKQHRVEASEWIVCENAHEAIISQELFDAVQAVRKDNMAKSPFGRPETAFKKDHNNRYKGLIVDGRSGLPMYRRARYSSCYTERRRLYYIFTSRSDVGRKMEFPMIHILEEYLDEIVKEQVLFLISQYGDKDDILAMVQNSVDEAAKALAQRIKTLQMSINSLSIKAQKHYEAYAMSKIDKDEYMNLKEHTSIQLDAYRSEIKVLEIQAEQLPIQFQKAKRFVNSLFKAGKQKRLDGELIRNLIEKIEVFDTQELKIHFNNILKEGGIQA